MSEKLKTSDFIIGNRVNKGIINAIHKNSIQVKDKSGNLFYVFEPITLTSEILLNIKGFYIEDETISSTFYEHEKHRIIIINSFGKFTVGFAQIEIIEISFLHELQNIFKCICGEELEFKTELK